MSKLEQWLGLDDQNTRRRERAPLWKRAAWHVLKTVVRKHPAGALSAAGRGLGYALQQGALEGVEAARDVVQNRSSSREQNHPASSRMQETVVLANRVSSLSPAEKRELLETLTPDARHDLEALARKHPPEDTKLHETSRSGM